MKGKIQPFKSKGQISKGERPWLRGPGETWRDRNLQLYHHGKHPISSMQSHSLLLSTHILPPHQASSTRQQGPEGQNPLQPSVQAWQRSIPQLLTQALSTFPPCQAWVSPGMGQLPGCGSISSLESFSWDPGKKQPLR